MTLGLTKRTWFPLQVVGCKVRLTTELNPTKHSAYRTITKVNHLRGTIGLI